MFGIRFVNMPHTYSALFVTAGKSFRVFNTSRILCGPVGLALAKRNHAYACERFAMLDPGAPCGVGDRLDAAITDWEREVTRLGGNADALPSVHDFHA